MTDMADVLRGRIFAGRELNERQIADIAAALSAAGFGPVQEAQADAWDEGYSACRTRPRIDGYLINRTNPYRGASDDGS